MSEESYDFSRPNTGVAAIFNHRNFEKRENRSDSETDVARLKDILDVYGFKVRVFNDLSSLDILQELQNLKKENHKDNNCLLVFVMTHGNSQKLWAKDETYSIDVIFQQFHGDNCQGLINKPKIFFIQANRVPTGDLGSSLNFDICDEVSQKIPITADFFVMFTSFEDSVSSNNPVGGNWFIQQFCKELKEASDDGIDLKDLARGISQKFAHEYWSRYIDTRKMPIRCSTLTKACFLKRKLPKNS